VRKHRLVRNQRLKNLLPLMRQFPRNSHKNNHKSQSLKLSNQLKHSQLRARVQPLKNLKNKPVSQPQKSQRARSHKNKKLRQRQRRLLLNSKGVKLSVNVLNLLFFGQSSL
jgi:hypothetical protein